MKKNDEAAGRRRKSVCILCGKEKQGVPVKEDRVIDAIRWFKKNVTKNEQHNFLVVCKEDYPRYRKERSKYTSRRIIYIGLTLFLGLGFFILNPSPLAVLLLLFLLALGYLFSLLNYMPDIVLGTPAAKEKAKMAKA
jgi:hypothetical protein